MNKATRWLIGGAAGVLCAVGVCGPANAWGPTARTAIVAAGTHLLGQDSSFTLSRSLKNVMQGAELPDEEFNKRFPLYAVDPVGAIQREMVLLQTMKSNRIDPYYAFRLGVLGRMVAGATAPLATNDGPEQDKYYADADKAISRTNLQPAARKFVDPRPYFSLMQSQAGSNDQTIEIEYRGGIGFGGIARAALGQDASRSVNAVADVWHTLLTSQPSAFEEPTAAKREYILGSIDFYLKQKDLGEAQATYRLAEEEGLIDTNTQKAIGDLYFDNALYEQAIVEYQKILAKDPGQRDVVDRVAKYYEMTGDSAADSEKLETAREAYAKAVAANSLHPDAQRKLLNVEARIFAREERLSQQRAAIEEARALEGRAEEAAIRQDYAQAIALLRDAEARYGTVTDEFAAESRDAVNGQRIVMMRTKELKQELIDNSASLSGSGVAFDARQIAAQTPDVSKKALEDMLQNEYQAAIRALGQQMDEPQR
jgi:tetratricopeptide (TPR) repeat protein